MELIQENMNKKQIEKFLRRLGGKETSRVSFSSYVEVEKTGNLVIIKLCRRGLIDNMQYDYAAFEGWAIVVKAAFEKVGVHVKVRIDGEKPKDFLENEEEHYNRFLYRISKFVEIFEWAYTDDFENEIAIFKNGVTL